MSTSTLARPEKVLPDERGIVLSPAFRSDALTAMVSEVLCRHNSC